MTVLVKPEEEQETMLPLSALLDMGMTVAKYLGCENQPIIDHRIRDGRKVQGVKQTMKGLRETAVPYRGSERVELLKRWICALKDIERFSENHFEGKEKNVEQNRALDEFRGSPRRPSMVLYYDPEVGGRLMNFHDVFLQIQALEGIALSMIFETPKDDEISLLLDMFGIRLTGGKEVHNAIVSSIQDLAQAFAGYEDEELMKREELKQLAQSAITGLKINCDIARIGTEAFKLKKMLDELGVTLKQVGYYKKQQADILLDSSSTHKFWELSIAKQVGCVTRGIPDQKIMVVKGDNAMIQVFVWQGIEFKVNELLMHLKGCEMIFGMGRLHMTEIIRWNSSDHTMEFQWKGEPIKLIASGMGQRQKVQSPPQKD